MSPPQQASQPDKSRANELLIPAETSVTSVGPNHRSVQVGTRVSRAAFHEAAFHTSQWSQASAVVRGGVLGLCQGPAYLGCQISLPPLFRTPSSSLLAIL